MNFLSMEYYKQFKCIGNECEDHCCKGWNITIDKKTFKNYKKLKKTDFSVKLNSNIKRNRNDIAGNNYGRFELVEGICPMLSEEGLCEVYLNIGEENMCHTCKVYPRSYNKVNDRIEGSLTLSCIEVAKKILLSEECIEFSLDEKKVHNNGFIKMIDTKNTNSYVVRNFDEIRSFCIGLVQQKKYNIEERLAILGLFIKDLSQIQDDNSVIEVINNYQQRINADIYGGILDRFELETMLEAQNEFCTSLYNVILTKSISEVRFVDKFKIASEYLKLNQSNIENRKEVIRETLSNEYNNFIKDHKYIYENYLVSYMFKTLFPVSDMSLMDNYDDLVVRFALIKITLIGLSGHYKNDMNVKYAVEFIQSFVKVVEHDNTIVKKINNYLKQNNMNTLAHMMIIMGK